MLTPGTRLRGYEVSGPLGAGGMGEVYRARDTALNRDVALKILPEPFAADAERLVRFTREAQLLASLNHPHIAHIYGLERQEGRDGPDGRGPLSFIVMELVDGEDLAARIARGPLPLDDALAIARQIAEALEAAHEQGIVHRDLKPANIKVRPDGTVKVLDFGLAKAVERAGPVGGVGGTGGLAVTNSPTLMSPLAMTGVGVILGTAAYMSPEQARGKAVDRRADIWAFGCILFEMLTGRRPFDGETISDVVAAVIHQEPPWSALPPETPARVRVLLKRCLEKDARQRLRDAGDARLELDAPERDLDVQPPSPAVVNQPRSGARAIGIAALLAAAAASALTWWWLARPVDRRPEVSRFSVSLAADAPLDVRGPWSSVAISRDGRTIAYIGQVGKTRQLFIRRADEAAPQRVTGAIDPWEAFFSPDGQWLAFVDTDRLKKVALTGGQPQLIAEAANLNSGVWADDGSIYLGGRAGLVKVDQNGHSTTLAKPEPNEVETSSPDLLPGGALLFTVKPYDVTSFDDARIAVLTPNGQRHVLIEGGTNARYSPTGHLVYARGGDILAVAFDADRLSISGQPIPLERGGMLDTASGTAHFALSRNGTLVYAPGGPVAQERTLAWVDRGGSITPIHAPGRFYSEPRISPDGHQIAFDVRAANDDIWTYDIDRGTAARLTFTHGNNQAPIWSPDGSRIVYAVDRLGVRRLAWRPSDGSGSEELLTPAEYYQTAGSFSPDGKLLAYTEDRPETAGDIFLLPLEGARKPIPFLATPFDERRPAFSPDGRWITYESNETGRFEVFAMPYPGPGRKWQVSNGGGLRPTWSRDGTEIVYATDDMTRLMAVRVKSTASTIDPGVPSELLNLLPLTEYFDVSPDGQRVLVVETGAARTVVRELNVILNWFETLKARVR